MKARIDSFSPNPRARQIVAFIALLVRVVSSPRIRGQIIPKQPSGFSDQAPNDSTACSLQKSCAELAPTMIQSALADRRGARDSSVRIGSAPLDSICSVQRRRRGLSRFSRYVEAHRSELNNAVAAIVFDSRSGAMTGYSAEGREDVLADVRDALEPLKSLSVTNFTSAAAIETDNFDFLLEGVSTLLPD